jgi:hypothetical protein
VRFQALVVTKHAPKLIPDLVEVWWLEKGIRLIGKLHHNDHSQAPQFSNVDKNRATIGAKATDHTLAIAYQIVLGGTRCGHLPALAGGGCGFALIHHLEYWLADLDVS